MCSSSWHQCWWWKCCPLFIKTLALEMPLEPFTPLALPCWTQYSWPVGSCSSWTLPLPKTPLQISSSGSPCRPERRLCRTHRVPPPAEQSLRSWGRQVSLRLLSLRLERSPCLASDSSSRRPWNSPASTLVSFQALPAWWHRWRISLDRGPGSLLGDDRARWARVCRSLQCPTVPGPPSVLWSSPCMPPHRLCPVPPAHCTASHTHDLQMSPSSLKLGTLSS